MHIVGVLNTKGGVGKSTLVACLSVRAAADRNTRVGVVDLDPQGSYGEWYKRRGSPDNPMLLRGEDRASDAIESLSLSMPFNYLFLDGPPGSLEVTEDAISASTLVVIPMRASGLDLDASQECIAICQEMRKPYLMVINAASHGERKLVEDARKVLFHWNAPTADALIGQRVPYVTALTSGKTGPEKDKKAAAEIDALWEEIKAALKKASRAPRKQRERANASHG